MNQYPACISNNQKLTYAESMILQLLLKNDGKVCSRDDIAQSIWGKLWIDKYSDWAIDAHIYKLKKKLIDGVKIKAIRNCGYVLEKKSLVVVRESVIDENVSLGVNPTDNYLVYMNNPKNVRKVYQDLWKAILRENVSSLDRMYSEDEEINILAVNSFSVDNMDYLMELISGRNNELDKVFFTNFYDKALKLHMDRKYQAGFGQVEVVWDDIRETRLKSDFFDLIINDFRLNFNDDYRQNIRMMEGMKKVLKTDGYLFLSAVVDCRYENERYGENQEKAPINKNRPWEFIGQEGLVRKCFTVPYYKKLISDVGFKMMSEFDIEGGKRWKNSADDAKRGLSYRRWLVRK